jgi:acyl-CoA dehydrogenase
LRRNIYSPDQHDFADVVRTFLEKSVAQHYADWERAGIVPREVYRQAGQAGIAGIQVPPEYGGSGRDSTFKFNAAMIEEMGRAQLGLTGLILHMNVLMPYFLRYTSQRQRARWLPGMAEGSLMTALAMTEPVAGSDLAGIRTTAERDGSGYVLNGAKTFITGGHNASVVIVVARTSRSDDRRAGLSLVVVEEGMPGFSRGRKLEKIGVRQADTSELFFSDVPVPATNLLGEEGAAFHYLTANLPQERLNIALQSVASAKAALATTIKYVQDRMAFGQKVSSFQNTKFVLAECVTELDAAQTFCDRALEELDAGELTAADAAKVKLFCTEMQGRVIDKCLQLHGGYGYMMEYPIARQYLDARVTRIFGGTNEVMKIIIAKSLGL